MIARRKLLAVAAVVDIALHARGKPVAAKALAARHGLAPRHLETLLQDLVRANILKGTRGPHGGYELARERRRISAGDVVRALERSSDEPVRSVERSPLFEDVIAPVVKDAVEAFLSTLDSMTIADLCREAETKHPASPPRRVDEFHI